MKKREEPKPKDDKESNDFARGSKPSGRDGGPPRRSDRGGDRNRDGDRTKIGDRSERKEEKSGDDAGGFGGFRSNAAGKGKGRK